LPVTEGPSAALLGAGAVKKRYGRGAIVHQAGDFCDRVEVILEGRVGVERIGETGDLMVLADFGPGDLLGAHLLFGPKPVYPMTVVTRTRPPCSGSAGSPAGSVVRGSRIFGILPCCDFEQHSVLSARIRDQHRRSIRDIVLVWLRERVQATVTGVCRSG
jgi:hypothetical protein